jgi:acyl dehydratase
MSDREEYPGVSSLFTAPGRTMVELTRAWTNASEQMLQNITEANQAVLSSFDAERAGKNGEKTPDKTLDSPLPSLAYTSSGWSFERDVENVNEVTVGDTLRFSKEFTDADVEAFAEATGDTNRLHLDESFASDTLFGEPIVHGILVLGLVSAALARLPGLTIYLSQGVDFLRPVTVGRRYTAVVEVVERLADDRFRLSAVVVNDDDEEVIEGESVVLVTDLPS